MLAKTVLDNSKLLAQNSGLHFYQQTQHVVDITVNTAVDSLSWILSNRAVDISFGVGCLQAKWKHTI